MKSIRSCILLNWAPELWLTIPIPQAHELGPGTVRFEDLFLRRRAANIYEPRFPVEVIVGPTSQVVILQQGRRNSLTVARDGAKLKCA